MPSPRSVTAITQVIGLRAGLSAKIKGFIGGLPSPQASSPGTYLVLDHAMSELAEVERRLGEATDDSSRSSGRVGSPSKRPSGQISEMSRAQAERSVVLGTHRVRHQEPDLLAEGLDTQGDIREHRHELTVRRSNSRS